MTYVIRLSKAETKLCKHSMGGAGHETSFRMGLGTRLTRERLRTRVHYWVCMFAYLWWDYVFTVGSRRFSLIPRIPLLAEWKVTESSGEGLGLRPRKVVCFFLLPHRGEHEGSRRMKTELLVQMDGLARSSDLVFVLAASNIPWWGDKTTLHRFCVFLW